MLKLITPTINQYQYRQFLLSDEKTMSYNIGFGDEGKGTIAITKKDYQDWYTHWISSKKWFYAYIYNEDVPVGEACFHYVEEYQSYMISLVIEYQYRRYGYGKEALKQLLKIAFEDYLLNDVIDLFPEDRITSKQLFMSLGFKIIEKIENNILIRLTKEDYQRYIDE